MRVYENRTYRDATAEEVKAMEEEAAQSEKAYWQNTDYDDAVNTQIRKRYSASGEFAVLRQQASKPEEYAQYYAYCEECKEYVRTRMAEHMEEMVT